MKKNKIFFNVITALLVVVYFASCKKDPEVGGTAVQKMAGEWFVHVDDDPVLYSMETYNTAANTVNEMWIGPLSLFLAGDLHPLAVKGKVSVDLNNQTFSGTDITNVLSDTQEDYPTFSVANGKVITNGTKGPASNTPADSIYFELQINGATHIVKGFQRTGFLQDEPTD